MTCNLFLIGPPGVGKTTIGRQLAKKLGLLFYDADHEIELRTGVPIATIFEIEGEAGFRKREQAMIDQLSQSRNIVLSLGGGAILSENNRLVLQARGVVIYLYASLETQLARIRQRKGTRPLLNTLNPKEILTQLNTIRQPLYQSIANHSYNTDADTPMEIAKQILALLPLPISTTGGGCR